MAGPLDGIRVLDLTTILLGPFATQIMGDMGADVVKVEPPDGDATRAIGPARNPGMAAVFLAVNRNKRSLVLDLKQDAGRRALLRLAEGADVFLHAMRPQAAERLGLAYDDIAAVNPKIVYCGTYGYRAAGPYGGRPAYDDMIQAACGVAGLLEMAFGAPAYVPSAIADKVAGISVVYAVALALLHRERTGEGQAVEVPMFETMVAFALPEHVYGLTFDPPIGGMGYPRQLSPDRRPYRTKDGTIGVLPFSDKQWRSFFEIAGRPDLADDQRFATMEARVANINALYGELARVLATRTTDEWLRDLEANDIPATRVNRPRDLLDDPHLAATGFWRRMDHPSEGRLRLMDEPVAFSRSPASLRRPAPRLGEHSAEILAEAGLDANEIAALMEAGVTRAPAE